MKSHTLKSHTFIQFLTHHGLLVRALNLNIDNSDKRVIIIFKYSTIELITYNLNVCPIIKSKWNYIFDTEFYLK